MDNSLQITTKHLKLFPCSLEVAQAFVNKNKSEIEELLGVTVPGDWFVCEVRDFFPIYVQMLQNDPSQLGWGVWLMIHVEKSTLIGDLGFGGKPDEQGSVEMGYEVLSAYRGQGYAFEAVQAFTNFVFTYPELKRIISHCPQDNPASLRILEKLKMQHLETFDSPEYPSAPILKFAMTAKD
ncbi:MAG TPA: GNAT family N-acetyltransferase [Nostocaceae cyanobacterium]|nr:GNAT family N-acetyltransferase [Nostocaceae cyanobacterium]